MRYALAATVFGIIFATLAFVHSVPAAQKTSSSTSSGKIVTVTLSENGFSPDPLTISQGTTVTFVTTADAFFWPASNPHPTHTIYPEFDPQQPIAPKDSWSFTFRKLGTWHYHDHLAPYYTGTIIVASSSAATP